MAANLADRNYLECISSSVVVAGVRSSVGIDGVNVATHQNATCNALGVGRRRHSLADPALALAYGVGGVDGGRYCCGNVGRVSASSKHNNDGVRIVIEQSWYVYSAIVLLASTSLICRTGYVLFGHLLPLPDRLQRALRYAPLAALTGIIVPELLPWHPELGPQVDLRLFAAVIATALFCWTRNSFVLIVSGMAVLWTARWLFLA